MIKLNKNIISYISFFTLPITWFQFQFLFLQKVSLWICVFRCNLRPQTLLYFTVIEESKGFPKSLHILHYMGFDLDFASLDIMINHKISIRVRQTLLSFEWKNLSSILANIELKVRWPIDKMERSIQFSEQILEMLLCTKVVIGRVLTLLMKKYLF